MCNKLQELKLRGINQYSEHFNVLLLSFSLKRDIEICLI